MDRLYLVYCINIHLLPQSVISGGLTWCVWCVISKLWWYVVLRCWTNNKRFPQKNELPPPSLLDFESLIVMNGNPCSMPATLDIITNNQQSSSPFSLFQPPPLSSPSLILRTPSTRAARTNNDHIKSYRAWGFATSKLSNGIFHTTLFVYYIITSDWWILLLYNIYIYVIVSTLGIWPPYSPPWRYRSNHGQMWYGSRCDVNFCNHGDTNVLACDLRTVVVPNPRSNARTGGGRCSQTTKLNISPTKCFWMASLRYNVFFPFKRTPHLHLASTNAACVCCCCKTYQ